MLTKTFVLHQFGAPHAWTDRFIEAVQPLAEYGWRWILVTPNDLPARGNVSIVPMTAEQFADRCAERTGVRPNLFVTSKGVPSVHVTEFCVASGDIFADELADSDYWGITNLDVVYGRLDHFLPDDELAKWDVWTDDVGVINGVFCLFRNAPIPNQLYRQIPQWEEKFAQPPCLRCVGLGDEHSLFGTDEYDLTEVMRTAPVTFGHPPRSPWHSHDRLELHVPFVKLSRDADGTLWERLADVAPPPWVHAHSHFDREVMYFHFSHTKVWPL